MIEPKTRTLRERKRGQDNEANVRQDRNCGRNGDADECRVGKQDKDEDDDGEKMSEGKRMACEAESEDRARQLTRS